MISARHSASARDAAALRNREKGRFAAGSRPIAERLWAKVDKEGPTPPHAPHLGPCWIWWGATTERGYGRIGSGSRGGQRVHRLAWAVTYGPVPEGQNVLHKCDQRACCNPAHLFIGSAQENTDDMFAKSRNAHRANASSGAPRLTDEQVAAVRAARANGEAIFHFVAEFRVATSTVYRIANTTGKQWWASPKEQARV